MSCQGLAPPGGALRAPRLLPSEGVQGDQTAHAEDAGVLDLEVPPGRVSPRHPVPTGHPGATLSGHLNISNNQQDVSVAQIPRAWTFSLALSGCLGAVFFLPFSDLTNQAFNTALSSGGESGARPPSL